MKRKLVDTDLIFRSKWAKYSFAPIKPFVEYALGIHKINQKYYQTQDLQPENVFAEKVLEAMGVDFHIHPKDIENLKKIEGPLLVVSNHPFGGLDALFMVIFLSHIREDYRIMANYLLKNIPEVTHKLIGVDPFENENSAQNNLAPLKEAMIWLKNGGLLGVFPAGEVASFKWKQRKVAEKPWSPTIAKLILKTQPTVVPLYFHGKNNWIFQLAASVHPKLQTAMLINTLVRPSVKKIHYQMGNPIAPEKLLEYKDPEILIQYLQGKTYLLSGRYKFQKFSFNVIRSFLPQSPARQEPILQDIDNSLIIKDIENIQHARLLTYQNFEVYCFEFHEAPMLMREIGRQREITFREVGEGSGKSIDLDIYDEHYLHLCIWDREKQKLVGAYRIGQADKILNEKGIAGLYTYSLFKMKKYLFKEINPALEMGRSFIVKEYQKTFAPLMLLWMGIGHFVAKNPQYKNLFGPVSISNDFNAVSKDLMVYFLKENNHLKDLEGFVKPRKKFQYLKSSQFYHSFSIKDIKDVQELMNDIESSGAKVPVLLKQYLNLGGKIIAFNVDPDFNDVLDGLILVDLTQTKPDILIKYMGYEGYKHFMNYHNKVIPSEVINRYSNKVT
ncbi:MAG: hemolysin [Bacteroidia bacterium]|nr:MAG: hemolysin [Bacteroidia bacterium]